MLLFREFIILLLSGERSREGNYNNIKYSDISSNTAADFPGLTFNPPLQHRIKNKSFPLSREISKERDWLNISNKQGKISFHDPACLDGGNDNDDSGVEKKIGRGKYKYDCGDEVKMIWCLNWD